MRVSVLKHSTSKLTVLIRSVDQSIASGVIYLKLFIGKDNTETIHKLNYSRFELVYDFNMSKKLPRSILDMDYVVEVSDGTTKDETRKISVGRGLPRHLSGVSKKIKRDFTLKAKHYNGSKAYFFKKLPSEETCSECWDRDLEASNNSNCRRCGGSGYMRYFANPYLTYCGPVKWSNEGHQVQSAGKEMVSTTVSIPALADFVMTTDDIIYHVQTGDFYRVTFRTSSELQSNSILQTLIANVVPTGYPDVEICSAILKKLGVKL